MSTLRKSLLALGCAAAFAGPAAAVTVTEAFDGAWVDASSIGRNKGMLVDYIPSANVFFFAFFTYDEDGNQVWLTNNFSVDSGTDTYTGLDALAFQGGAFSSEGSPAALSLGSVDLTLSCTGISAEFTPNAESGLAPASFDFVPSLGLDVLTTGECATALQACPAGTTASGADCVLPNAITNDLFLPAGKKYIVAGRVAVEAGGSLTIAPGVTVEGSSDTSLANFILVKADGQIHAEGTPDLPITFTGPEPIPGSWAGIVIAGRSQCNASAEPLGCQFEADTTGDVFFGGDQVDDSSGALRYVRILWAGQRINPDEELNSLTLLGVGAGTVLEHVQVDGGLDDGFEMFGGTVDGRYLVCSNMGDDCFDFDDGYQGRIQFALGWQGENPDAGTDSNGIESDNDSGNNNLEPRTAPTVANMTLVGGPVGNEGMRVRRGSGGIYSNIVVTGYQDRCVNLDDSGTFALASGTAQGALLSMDHAFVGQCGAGAFQDDGADPYAVSAWYGAGAGNGQGDPMLQGFLPEAGSPVVDGGQVNGDAFFRPTRYRGAFAGPRDNWTRGWTVNLPGQ